MEGVCFRLAAAARTVCSMLFVGLLVAACAEPSHPPAEEEVRALINQAEERAEDRDLEAFRDLIAEDYADPRGNNRQSLLLMLNYYFSANRAVHLLTRTPRVHFNDSSHADVLVFVAMAGRPIAGEDQISSMNADLYHVYASVRREDDQWQITSARWSRGWDAELDASEAGQVLRDRR